MPPLSFDTTAQEHKKLKAIAAFKGQSIKQYVLGRTLKGIPDTSCMTDDEAYLGGITDGCKGLSRRDRPNDFCQSIPQSTILFTFNAISFLEKHYASFGVKQ